MGLFDGARLKMMKGALTKSGVSERNIELLTDHAICSDVVGLFDGFHKHRKILTYSAGTKGVAVAFSGTGPHADSGVDKVRTKSCSVNVGKDTPYEYVLRDMFNMLGSLISRFDITAIDGACMFTIKMNTMHVKAVSDYVEAAEAESDAKVDAYMAIRTASQNLASSADEYLMSCVLYGDFEKAIFHCLDNFLGDSVQIRHRSLNGDFVPVESLESTLCHISETGGARTQTGKFGLEFDFYDAPIYKAAARRSYTGGAPQ